MKQERFHNRYNRGNLAYLYVSIGILLLPIISHILIDARIVSLAPAILRLHHRHQAQPNAAWKSFQR